MNKFTKGSLYILKSDYKDERASLSVTKDDTDGTANGFGNASQCKLIKTLPGLEAKVGDTVIRFKDGTSTCPTGTVFTVLEIDRSFLYYTSDLSANTYECKVLCKAYTAEAESVSTEKRSLAYYKRSGKPWTVKELCRIPGLWKKAFSTNRLTYKWIFDNGDKVGYMYPWLDQENNATFSNCLQIAYEDVFEEINEKLPDEKHNYTNYCAEITLEQPLPCALNIDQQKENIMNEIKIEINGKQVDLGTSKPVKIKSDLKLSSDWVTLWYNEDGKFVRHTEDSPKKAKKLLQKVANIGYTIRCYKITESATTDIPVVNIAV